MFRRIILILTTLCMIIIPAIYTDLLYLLYIYSGVIMMMLLFNVFYIRKRTEKRVRAKIKSFKCPRCRKKSFRLKDSDIHVCCYCYTKFTAYPDRIQTELTKVEEDYYEVVISLIQHVIKRDKRESKSQPEFINQLLYYLFGKDLEKVKMIDERIKQSEGLNLRRILIKLNEHDLSDSTKDSLIKVILDISSLDYPVNPNVYREIKKIIHYYDLSQDKYEALKNKLSNRNEFPKHLDLYNQLFNRILVCSKDREEFNYTVVKEFYTNIGFEPRYIEKCKERIMHHESQKRPFIVAKQIYNQTTSHAYSHYLLETLLRFVNHSKSINKIQMRDLKQISKALNITSDDFNMIKQAVLH